MPKPAAHLLKSSAPRRRLDMDLLELVVVEGQPVLEVAVLVVRFFVTPDRVLELPVAELQVEIPRGALERALRRGARSLEHVHLHVRTRKVVAARVVVLVDADDAA